MTTHERAVVIAGGGPTGMTLAGELALAGVDVAIVERRPSQELGVGAPGDRRGPGPERGARPARRPRRLGGRRIRRGARRGAEDAHQTYIHTA